MAHPVSLTPQAPLGPPWAGGLLPGVFLALGLTDGTWTGQRTGHGWLLQEASGCREGAGAAVMPGLMEHSLLREDPTEKPMGQHICRRNLLCPNLTPRNIMLNQLLLRWMLFSTCRWYAPGVTLPRRLHASTVLRHYATT